MTQWDFNHMINQTAIAMSEALYHHTIRAMPYQYGDQTAVKVNYYKPDEVLCKRIIKWDILQERIKYGQNENIFIPDLSCLVRGVDPLNPTTIPLREITKVDSDENVLSYRLFFDAPVLLDDVLSKNIADAYTKVINSIEPGQKDIPVLVRLGYWEKFRSSSQESDRKIVLACSEQLQVYTKEEWDQIKEDRRYER